MVNVNVLTGTSCAASITLFERKEAFLRSVNFRYLPLVFDLVNLQVPEAVWHSGGYESCVDVVGGCRG